MHKIKPKLWTKDFIVLFFTTFCVFLILHLLLTTLAIYTVEEFAAPKSMAGLVAGIFIIGELIGRLITGRYLEIWGRKRTLFTGLILFLLIMLLYFPVQSLTILLIIRFGHGLAFGVVVTVLAVAVVEVIPSERRGEGISYYSMSMTLAMGFGPFVGSYLTIHANFTVLFMVCVLLAAISILIALPANISEMTAPKRPRSQKKWPVVGFDFKNYFEIKALPISIFIFIMTYTFSGVLTFLTSYAREINLVHPATYFFIVYAVSILISRLITGPLFDKKGENIVIFPSLVSFASGMLLFSQARHGFILLLAAALIGLGFGSLNSCCQAIAVKVSPKHRVGLATSTYFVLLDGGLGIGPFLHGLVIPFSGFRGLYLILTVILFAAIPLYYLLHGKKAMTYNTKSL
ncbi:MAG: MFS transporter [Peptococcaceae bacterium]|nr:MFS transporter [Peptococcaceae bacterium]